MPNREKTALQIAKELDYKPPKCGYYWHDDFTIFSVYDIGETDTKRYKGVAQSLHVEKDVELLIGADDIVSFTVVKKRTKIKV